ncbi:probable receptor-like protein kinase At2g42960 [Lolium perenne]|uniref:probable receptor-like protein kinase At2g42960 n=1 Tax=Lolium perenne TaxID=4522 RepID=UPI0021F66878|nr:probable receptor-like protein kinase At2g42960 [Lolium perenne]
MSDLSAEMLRKVLGLTLWVWIAIGVVALLVAILLMICIWAASRRRTKRTMDTLSQTQIPIYSKEIPVDRVGGGGRSLAQTMHERDHPSFPPQDSKHASREPGKTPGHVALSKSSDHDNVSQGSSVCNVDRVGSVHSGEDGSSGHARKPYSPAAFVSASPLVGLPEFSHLGWGHWFTLRDLEFATNRFSKENVLGEGGYGVVYRGRLVNGTEVAIKKIFNNMGQAEKEFRVEVEAIGHVRHKNLVRLLGYCVEGVNRMLVYEFVNNGNLEQWLHGAMRQHGVFTWENRMKVVIGTAKALAYLHEAIEPKVVHRDIKSSNILIDNEFNGKVSDFGLAKMLGSDKSHITTRVMGTFGYVAPEYANTGMLNEKSDVYSFGVLLLETVTGRDPVDYSRSANEVNLVEWLKMMIANRRAEEVVDPILEIRPTIRALKRALLIALRCVDPDSEKRPKMGQVARMLESEEVPYREDRRNRRSRTGSMDIESITEGSNSAEFANKVERTGSSTSDRSQS